MSKLSPPLIEGTIPAFYKNEDGTAFLTVPFSMNRAVSPVQVGGFTLKLKTVQSGAALLDITTIDDRNFNLEDSPYVTFKLTEKQVDLLRVGQFYKIQIAYIYCSNNIKAALKKKLEDVYKQYQSPNNNLTEDYETAVENVYKEYLEKIQEQPDYMGHFSTVSIIKYTTKPKVIIDQLIEGNANNNLQEYRGLYETADVNERVYSYKFDLYDPYGNLAHSSGELLHNSQNDTELNKSYDTYLLPQELETGAIYRVQYTITTNNLLTISSPLYRIIQKSSIAPEVKATLECILNYDNGYITINLVGEKTEGREEPVTGAFLLSRAAEATGYMVWDEVSRFKLEGQTPSRQLLRDFTIEQGQRYRYALQQYNDKGLYSDRLLSNIVYADFEDAFLFDGEKQLKIKYNPKVSSFKKNVLETKTDTIGGKHPFIFRNGNVNYSEFPISGLISYQMDEEKLFMSETDYLLDEKTTNLISENITSERLFKMKVLEWLTNGKPKLFRSPSEGNYIVRLMNTSLSPNDTLGRMLHTFSSTAYEIAECTYAKLNEMGFITLNNPEVEVLRWETQPFYNINANGDRQIRGVINNYEVVSAYINDVTPGDSIKVTFTDDTSEIIQIGVTGSYYLNSDMKIKSISPIAPFASYNASVTYSYYSVQSNVFNKIDSVSIKEIVPHQFIGEHDLIKEIEYVYDADNDVWIKNPKVSIAKIYELSLRKRNLERLVIKDGKYYYDAAATIEFNVEDADPFTLYECGTWEAKKPNYDGYRPGYPDQQFILKYYKDFYNNNKEYDTYNTQVIFNNTKSTIDLNEIEYRQIKEPDIFNLLQIGNGVIAEISYQLRDIEYSIETDDTYQDSYLARWDYEDAVYNLNAYYRNVDKGQGDISTIQSSSSYINSIQASYTQYIIKLVKAQEEEKRAEGLII